MPQPKPQQSQKNTLALNHDEVLHSWITPEYIKFEKTTRWYVTAGTILLILIAYAIASGSATMAIVFILIGGMFFMIKNEEPKMQTIAITKLGVYVDKHFYPYSSIDAFWIVYEPPYIRSLYLSVNKGRRILNIQLNDQDPAKIRHLLQKEVREAEDRHEEWTDTLIRLLRLH